MERDGKAYGRPFKIDQIHPCMMEEGLPVGPFAVGALPNAASSWKKLPRPQLGTCSWADTICSSPKLFQAVTPVTACRDRGPDSKTRGDCDGQKPPWSEFGLTVVRASALRLFTKEPTGFKAGKTDVACEVVRESAVVYWWAAY